VIDSIRRECIDHVIPAGERHLLRTLQAYAHSHDSARTHISLDGDSATAFHHCRE
jgi:hypothetical protein